jgi:multidrug resistance efflux pump
VQPEKDTRLTFESAGTITRVAVSAGDRITSGQVLAELDTADLDLVVCQAQISLRTAQAQLQQSFGGPAQ